MVTKEKPININTNNNTNNVNVKVHVLHPKRSSVKKKSKPNWYTRTIIGGIIALILSVGGYFLKKKIDIKNNATNNVVVPNGQPTEGTKQN